MSEEIVLNVLVDAAGNELDIKTSFVVRDVTYTKPMRVPLYVAGALKSAEELAALGLTVKGYTQNELDAKTYAGYYAANPALATRVRQYSALLATLGLTATATSDEVTAAIKASGMTDAEKTETSATVLALIHDIELNYNAVSGDGLGAWAVLEKLIRYLPAETSETSDIS